jgi:Uma2 family endonuclease
MSASPVPRISPEEYLAIERAAEFKSEYFDGRMYAMSGGTFQHALVIANVIASLGNVSRGKNCVVVGSDLRLRVAINGLYTYPDAVVICGQARFADDQKDTLLNPALIVEVLSKSTEAHDRGFKFAQYRSLEPLREYMLVSQTEPRVELYRRQSASEWVLSETVGLEGACRLATIEGALSMSDIYANVSDI